MRDDARARATDTGEADLDSWDLRSLDVQPHHPQVLRSDTEARLIAIQLPEGEALHQHRVHERAYLIVAGGEIEVSAGDRSETGGPGFLAHWEATEDHEIRATSDARLLLVLAPWPGEGHSSERAGGGDPT
jgi:quercetin dioxygenase-like cupin family protein